MGAQMNDLEFTKKVIGVLNEAEVQKVLKKAITHGMVIPGFSKNPAKAPKQTIMMSLSQRSKGEYYYAIILKVMYEFANNEFADNQRFLFVKRWRDNKSEHEKIEEELGQLIEYMKSENSETADTTIVAEEDRNVKLKDVERELVKKITVLQERNKKLQASIQRKKIEADNLNKNFQKAQKENEKQKTEINKLEQQIVELEMSREVLRKEIFEKNSCIKNLLEQIEELSKYREHAPKILCFLKTKEEINFEGCDVTIADRWDLEVKESLAQVVFDEIWYVHKGFQYGDFIEMKENFTCRIQEFTNAQQLVEYIGGQR